MQASPATALHSTLMCAQMLAQDRLDSRVVVLHADAASKAAAQPSFTQTLAKAGQSALGGGLPGAGAMAVQVLSLMWLRTTMNWRACRLRCRLRSPRRRVPPRRHHVWDH